MALDPRFFPLKERLNMGAKENPNYKLRHGYDIENFLGPIQSYSAPQADFYEGLLKAEAQKSDQDLQAEGLAKAKRLSGIEDVLAAQAAAANARGNPLAARQAAFAGALAQQKASGEAGVLGAQLGAQLQAQRQQAIQQGLSLQQLKLQEALDKRAREQANKQLAIQLGYSQQKKGLFEKYGLPALGAASQIGAAAVGA